MGAKIKPVLGATPSYLPLNIYQDAEHIFPVFGSCGCATLIPHAIFVRTAPNAAYSVVLITLFRYSRRLYLCCALECLIAFIAT